MRDLCFSHGTTYGHAQAHGWHTVATRCGRPTSPHAPIEHRTRPTTTWDGYSAVETMHSTAQPRQHASDRTQQAQTHTVRRAPSTTGKRRLRTHTQSCCKDFGAQQHTQDTSGNCPEHW